MTNSGRVVLGDVIVSLDDKPIDSAEALSDALDLRRPGDTVQLGIVRDGKELVLPVRLSGVNQ
jgi:S1-C subfamily serine protease